MRPRARLAIQGSIRSRCLEKLSTAHCSKTLHYLITTAPSLGGRMSPAASVPPSMCHPPQGWTRGRKISMSWPHTGALPVGPWSTCLLAAWVQMWLQKAISDSPYPAAAEKGGERAVLGAGRQQRAPNPRRQVPPAGRAGPACWREQRCCTMALALKHRAKPLQPAESSGGITGR